MKRRWNDGEGRWVSGRSPLHRASLPLPPILRRPRPSRWPRRRFAGCLDFENLTASCAGGTRPGAGTSVSQTDGGVTLKVARTLGTAFDVYGCSNGPQPGDPIGCRRWLDGLNTKVEEPSIQSVTATMNSPFNSCILDNGFGVVQSAPESGALVALGLGGLGLLNRTRRSRRGIGVR